MTQAPPPEVPPLSPDDDRRRERLGVIFRAYYPLLYDFARLYGTRAAADADDAIQTVMAGLLEQQSELLEVPSDPAAQATQAVALRRYLYSSVRGRMLNRSQSERSRDQLIAGVAHTLQPTSLGRPDWDVEAAELAQHLRAALRLLSPQERRVFRLVRIEGLTHAAAAARLKIQRGTVQVILERAMAKLERALAPWLPEGRSARTVSCKRGRNDMLSSPQEATAPKPRSRPAND